MWSCGRSYRYGSSVISFCKYSSVCETDYHLLFGLFYAVISIVPLLLQVNTYVFWIYSASSPSLGHLSLSIIMVRTDAYAFLVMHFSQFFGMTSRLQHVVPFLYAVSFFYLQDVWTHFKSWYFFSKKAWTNLKIILILFNIHENYTSPFYLSIF